MQLGRRAAVEVRVLQLQKTLASQGGNWFSFSVPPSEICGSCFGKTYGLCSVRGIFLLIKAPPLFTSIGMDRIYSVTL